VPLTAVTLTDEFWAPRRRINREVTLPSQYRLLEETGRIDNFRGAAGMDPAQFWRKGQTRFVHCGPYYNSTEPSNFDAAASLAGLIEGLL